VCGYVRLCVALCGCVWLHVGVPGSIAISLRDVGPGLLPPVAYAYKIEEEEERETELMSWICSNL
jgi:hypothetical protein